MHLSDHAPMLTVAPGGWDRCICRHCRISGDDGIRRSARTIERRLLAAEIAEAMSDAADTGEGFIRFVPAVVTEHIATLADCWRFEGETGDVIDVSEYNFQRELEDLVDLGHFCGCDTAIVDAWDGRAYCWECS